MENTSLKKNQSYCRCSTVQASDDRMIAPAGRKEDSDQPRQRKPRAKNSSAIGAATQTASNSSHSAPSACADFRTSPMKPGAISRPIARDSRSQPVTSTTRVPRPSAKFFHEVQRSARYSANGVREKRVAIQHAAATAGNPMMTESEIVSPEPPA